jgi:Zn-dependent protease
MYLLNLWQEHPLLALAFVVVIVIAITVHEAAHCWTAKQLGDPTPELAGRVNLNPAAHLDPLGTLLIFFVGFGWGRPAPFNPTYFRHYKQGTALVAVAGPLSNLALLTISALALKLGLSFGNEFIEAFWYQMITLNLLLALFNLIPIPPLDGSKILYAFLPARLDDTYEQLDRLGPLLLIGLLLFGGSLLMHIYAPALDAVFRFFGL